MEICTRQILVDKETKTAIIDATDNKYIYIVSNGQVEAVPLMKFGTLEIACQNYNIGNLAYKGTIKRK